MQLPGTRSECSPKPGHEGTEFTDKLSKAFLFSAMREFAYGIIVESSLQVLHILG
jgi:hypothetical protein